MSWAKRHERVLWWVVLISSLVVGVIRDPSCATRTPAWAYALPLVVFVVMFGVLIYGMRRFPRVKR